MSQQEEQYPLPLARPLPESCRLQRRILRLADGYETSVQEHIPAAQTRLPAIYVHGIQSHPGWFVGSAAALAGRGHAVFQVTRRGSGANMHARGHADSAGQLLDDTETACRFVLRRTGADRVHLVGVSWGGKLLAALLASRPVPYAASLTLVAPGIAPRVDVGARVKLSVALCLLLRPRRMFDIPLNDPALFTDNEEMRRYIRDDAFRLHRATARFLLASRRMDSMLRNAPTGALKAPTTLLLATRDRIINNAATRAVVERLTAARAAVEILNAAHTLEFEPDPQPFFSALAAALDRGS